MTDHPHRFVALCPNTTEELRVARETVRALELDGNPSPGTSFSSPVSETGNSPATWFGLSADCTDFTKNALDDVLERGILPEGINWTAYNITTDDVLRVAALIKYGWSVQDDNDAFDNLLAREDVNLKRIELDPEATTLEGQKT